MWQRPQQHGCYKHVSAIIYTTKCHHGLARHCQLEGHACTLGCLCTFIQDLLPQWPQAQAHFVRSSSYSTASEEAALSMGQQQEHSSPVRLLPGAMHQLVRSMLNVTGIAEPSHASLSTAFEKGTASSSYSATWAHFEERWRAAGRRKLEEFVQHKVQLGLAAESEALLSQPQLPAEHSICACCVRCTARRVRYAGQSSSNGGIHPANGLAQLTSCAGCSSHPADVIVHLSTVHGDDPSAEHHKASHTCSMPVLLSRAHSVSGPIPGQHAALPLSPLSCQHELLRRLIPTASLSRADASRHDPLSAGPDRSLAGSSPHKLRQALSQPAGQHSTAGDVPPARPAVSAAAGRGAQKETVGSNAADAADDADATGAMASDPLVDLLLEQIKELMKEKSELQTQVCWLLAENSAMQELIGFLAENQREDEAEDLLHEQYAPSELQELRRLISREPLLVQM